MDSVSESADFDFGGADSGIEDLEMGFVADDGRRAYRAAPERLAPGPRESTELAAPPPPSFGFELHVPEFRDFPKRTKSVIGILVGGTVGGFLVGGPVGGVAGAVLGFLVMDHSPGPRRLDT